jgi:uncharacterized protein YceK
MKKICMLFVIALLFSGCASFQHAESIDVDHYGATGHYTDSRSGKLYMATLSAAGGGGGQNVGVGGFLFGMVSNQSQSDPRNFAKAVAMMDMSKKIKYVKYDEETGTREYEFVHPLAGLERKPSKSSNLPPSFGREPVQ